ncbi:uncharacterized protein LOC129231065 [Uloborus diversus]|uniref:uncharacterized protein LOC129231065 n=1 Tax=Uloborus diversus TaxID=327109 RepID=UPI002409C960|nr:uncharacterized protein LOC129231065 [Uloborus diversus]
MAIHCQLLFSTLCYGIVFVCKLIEIGTIAYQKSSEKKCYLFAKPENDPPSALPCTISIYISGGTSVYALIMAIYHGCGTVAAYKENHIGRSMWVMPWLLLNSFALIITFSCACVYSVGLYISCSNTPSVLPSTGSCSMKTSSYRVMFTAEISIWITVLLWCILIALEAVRLRRNQRARAENTYVDPVEPTTADDVPISELKSTA